MTIWEQLDDTIRQFTRTMSKTYLFDTIRLDLILHFFLGVILTLLIRKWKKSPLFGFALVLLIQLIKEFYDSFTLNASVKESIIDTAVTVIYPFTLIIIEKFLKKTGRA